MSKDILIIDSDTLSLELLDLEKGVEEYLAFFIWDEELFAKRHINQMRKEFIYEALRQNSELTLIEGDSQEVLLYLEEHHKESIILYASDFDDRFKGARLKRISKCDRAKKIEPLPRGFFSFYKKVMMQK